MIFWILLSIISLSVMAVLIWPLIRYSSKIAAMALVSLPIVAILLYQHWGSYAEVKQAGLIRERLVSVKQQIAQEGSRRSLIKQFESHLQAKPDSAQGWYLLGKLYLSENELAKAVDAFSKANKLQANNPEIMLALAEAKFLVHQSLDVEAKALLKAVLAKEPNAVGAYSLLAIDAYNRRLYKDAVAYWEKLLPFYPPESEEVKKVLELIAKAQAA